LNPIITAAVHCMGRDEAPKAQTTRRYRDPVEFKIGSCYALLSQLGGWGSIWCSRGWSEHSPHFK